MRRRPVSLLLLLAIPTLLQAASLIRNGDFENVADSGQPRHWVSAQHAGGKAYEFVSTTDSVHKGERSMMIRRFKPQIWGLTEQIIDAEALVGKTLEFSIAARAEQVGESGAALYLSAFSGSSLITQQDLRLVGDQDWKKHTLRLEIPEGTTKVRVGVSLDDAGTVWIDDARLIVVKRARKS